MIPRPCSPLSSKPRHEMQRQRQHNTDIPWPFRLYCSLKDKKQRGSHPPGPCHGTCAWHMPGSAAGSLPAGAAMGMLGCVLQCRPGELRAPCPPRCPPLAAGARLGLAPACMAQGWLSPRSLSGSHKVQASLHGSLCMGNASVLLPAAVPVLVTPQGMGPLAEDSGCSPCRESLAPCEHVRLAMVPGTS